MNVGHLVFRADSLTYTVAKALTWAGHDVHVWVVDPEHETRPPDRIQARLYAMPGVKLIPAAETLLPPRLDRLIVQMFPRPPECLRDLDRLAARADRITLVSAGDRSRSWRHALRMQRMEISQFARYAAKLDRVVYKDGFHAWDLFRPLKLRHVVGFDVHSQFLHDADSYDAIHALDWDPGRVRSIRANFLGSQDPPARRRILDSVRAHFASAPAATTSVSPGKHMYWHEFSDASPAALGPREFLEVLSDSDFTLCPLGYSLVTHRPMEALLRGSIPVLSERELDLYDVELRDGVNCIAVADGQWPQAVDRLARFDESQLVEMRTHVRRMHGELLDYPASAARMRTRLGFSEPDTAAHP